MNDSLIEQMSWVTNWPTASEQLMYDRFNTVCQLATHLEFKLLIRMSVCFNQFYPLGFAEQVQYLLLDYINSLFSCHSTIHRGNCRI